MERQKGEREKGTEKSNLKKEGGNVDTKRGVCV